MSLSDWPALPFEPWQATCETLHAHTQVLGKLAATLAPPEPQLQHAALRLTARGWETLPLPAPDGSGAIVVALDLRSHEAVVEHSDGRVERVPLTPNRPVADVTRRRPGRRATTRWACRDQPHATGDALDDTPRRGPRARQHTSPPRSQRTSPPRPERRSSSLRSARRTAAALPRSTRGGARSTSP